MQQIKPTVLWKYLGTKNINSFLRFFWNAVVVFTIGLSMQLATSAIAQTSSSRTSISKDEQEVKSVEERYLANAQYLKKYYGRIDQLKQTSKDIQFLAMIKVDYLDKGKTTEEKAIGKKAAGLGPKVEMQAREIYASSLEEQYMKGGMDVKVQTLGTEKRTLRITHALMSKPLVYKFQNEVKLDEQAATFGFRKLIYTNGFQSSLGESWTVDLKR